MAENKGVIKEIARERIRILYELATEAQESDPELSARYVRLIRQISRHYRIRLGKDVKRHICGKCGSILVPGKNAVVRIASSRRAILYVCGKCNAENRIRY